MKIIIYATHSSGTYEELKKDEDIVVLGYGTKWEGYIKKAKTILEYLNTLHNDEIVVILDGFDSYIKKKTNLIETFYNFDCNVLVSLDDNVGYKEYIPECMYKYIMNKIFGTCKHGYGANSGLIMGYVKYLQIVYKFIIDGPSNDDQRNFNISCSKFPFIKIDIEHIIFQNCTSIECIENSNAFFCQNPGIVSLNRFFRGIGEYYEYFIEEIIFIIMIIVLIIIIFRKIINYINK